jgi:hypothetical protein
VECIDRFDVIGKKAEMEKELQEWIESSPERKERWGNLLNDLKVKYLAVETPERNVNYYRETLVRGTRISRACSKLNAFRTTVMMSQGMTPKKTFELKNGPDPAETEFCKTYRFCGKQFQKSIDAILKEYEGFDLRVERDLFRFAVEEFYSNVDHAFIGEFQKKLYDENSQKIDDVLHTDYDRIAGYIWENSFFTDEQRIKVAFRIVCAVCIRSIQNHRQRRIFPEQRVNNWLHTLFFFLQNCARRA